MEIEKFRKEYYKKFHLSKNKKLLESIDELPALMKRPLNDKQKHKLGDTTHRIVFEKNAVHQADLLSLPDDDGYKYALVVVDMATRRVEAVPLKTKNSKVVSEALEKIYKTKNWRIPDALNVDSGGEFADFIKKHPDIVSVAEPALHRQVALVESANYELGKAIFERQNAQELITGEPSKEWKDDLKIFVDALNENWIREPVDKSEESTAGMGNKLGELIAKDTVEKGDIPDDEFFKKIADFESQEINNTKAIIPDGTMVRVKLTEPVAITGEKLHGKFRAGDIRWEIMPVKIHRLIIKPLLPPLYMVKEKNGRVRNSAYTQSDLQIVNKDEMPPPSTVIRGKPNKYIPYEIIDERKKNGKKEYLIRWKGFSKEDDTWENENVAKYLF